MVNPRLQMSVFSSIRFTLFPSVAARISGLAHLELTSSEQNDLPWSANQEWRMSTKRSVSHVTNFDISYVFTSPID